MFKTVLALVAGSIILIGAIRRVQTIGSWEFVVTVRVTVFLFTAFAIGLFIVDTEATRALASELLPGREAKHLGSNAWMTLFSFALLPAIYQIISGQRFTQVWDYLLVCWLIPLAVFIVTVVVYNVGESDFSVMAMQALWFVGAAAVLGFAHAVVGPVLAAFNISIIVASALGAGVFSISLFDVFEWLGHLGIYSEALKWILLVGSTALGLHGTVSLSSLKELLTGS